MNKLKRILALVGVVLLLSLYAATFITAFIKSPAYAGFFKTSLYCTIFVPLALYAFMLVYKAFVKKKEDKDKQ